MKGWFTITNPRRHSTRVDPRPFRWGISYGGVVHKVHHDADGKFDDFPYHVDHLTPVTFRLGIALWAADLYGPGLLCGGPFTTRRPNEVP
jgi:hypothetical protein